MTKVEMHFELTRPLDDVLLHRIAESHTVYGLQKVRLSDAPNHILVEYDASRLTPAQVEATLRRAGIPARRAQLSAPTASA